MKLISDGHRPYYGAPYSRRHPQLLRWLTLLLITAMISGGIIAFVIINAIAKKKPVDNRMNSRLFFMSPKLHNSQPQNSTLDLTGYGYRVAAPIDNRHNGSHEPFINDFFRESPMQEIKTKIETDMVYFGAEPMDIDHQNLISIRPTVHVFYPDVKGHMWSNCKATVNLGMTATQDGATILNKNYRMVYTSSGLDREYEGRVVTTIEQGANITLGITLRKTLDQFYADLAKVIPKKQIQLNNVLFNTGSSDLSEASQANLQKVIEYMKSHPKASIELDGYTDTLGDFVKDQELSCKRVKVVKSYLVHHGIRSRKIKTDAFGPNYPVSAGHSEDSHALNRRVEITILKN